jgi:hypothetical protein
MTSLAIILLVIVLALGITPSWQAQEPPEQKKECGTVVTEAQSRAEIARAGRTARRRFAPQVARPYHLPLTIHIVRRSNGTGGFTLDQLAIAMRDLNQMWQPVGVQFFQYGPVDYINSDYYFSIPNSEARRDELRMVNPVPNTINVYFTNLASICGQSSFTTSSPQGVLIDNGCAGVASPSTFAHEVGHYFDLYHTHETTFGRECPNGRNCTTAGDLLCDTPADPNLNGRVSSACVYDNSASPPTGCGTTPYAPSTRNLMSYSTKLCRNQFTSDQINKILDTLEDERSNLVTSGVRYVASDASPFSFACTYQSPCPTVGRAISVASPGTHIFILSGSYSGTLTASKAVFLKKWDLGAAPAKIGQ